MNEYGPGDVVEYRDNRVGEIKQFGGYIIMEWKQQPLTELSDNQRCVFGMSNGLKEIVESSNIDYVEIKNGTIPANVLDSYDVLSSNDKFFNSDMQEDQILIEIPQ